MQAMSEFKFLCPVCGQHIATDSSASGTQIECPTCFQKIVVPPAPTSASKYILSATQYIHPPAVPHAPAPPRSVSLTSWKGFGPAVFAAAALLCVLGGVIYMQCGRSSEPNPETLSDPAADSAVPARPAAVWRLNLANAEIPGAIAAGKIHDTEFVCERAVLQNSSLQLRQSSGQRPDAEVVVYLFTNDPRDLNGKSFSIGTNDNATNPRIELRWKEDRLQMTQKFTNGFAMKLQFGDIASGKLPGEIYLCLPDSTESCVAGSFLAEFKKFLPPKHP
jgi:DNA-directed RNA polymerase subunit RPC12/RpoP